MCCMLTTLFVVGPRMAILVWWLIRPVYVGAAFDNPILTLLAWLFIPWTVLMYLIICYYVIYGIFANAGINIAFSNGVT